MFFIIFIALWAVTIARVVFCMHATAGMLISFFMSFFTLMEVDLYVSENHLCFVYGPLKPSRLYIN